MTKLNLARRATAVAVAALGACMLALVCPVSVLAAARPSAAVHTGTTTSSGEDTPLNLGGTGSAVHAASGGASIVRTIVGLAIVIAVIVGLAWVLRQVKAGRDPHVGNAGLTSVAALMLGSGRSVHLVRAGSEYVLLASAEHTMVPIHRYSEEEARDAGLPTLDELASDPQARRPLLRAAGSSGSGRYDPTRIPSAASEVLERLRQWTVRR